MRLAALGWKVAVRCHWLTYLLSCLFHLFRVGRAHKLVGLCDFARLIAEQLCHGRELFLLITRGECGIFSVNLELYGTMQQPVPTYRTGCLQFIINQYDVRMQQEDVATVLGQRSFAESVFRCLGNAGFF